MQGFSVYSRPGRPRWYLCYRSVETLDWEDMVTPFRLDEDGGQRKAVKLGEEKAREFAKLGQVRAREAWHVWVVPFFHERYRENQALTRIRYLNAWTWLSLYLKDRKVTLPARLNYSTALGYLDWRVKKKRHCGKLCSRNTALTELRVLSIVMREAVRRDFCQGNPCDQLELRRDQVKQKPELNRETIALIRTAVGAREAHLPLPQRWMSICFEIALHQTFRLRETSIPMERIDLEARTILWIGKGRNGKPKQGTTLLHDELVPLIQALRAAGATHTCILPPMAAKIWWELRKELGIEHTTFHSTRVTAITEMVRNDVPEPKARAFANHSSWLVHQIYQRLKPADLSGVTAGLRFGSNPALRVDAAKPAPPGNPAGA